MYFQQSFKYQLDDKNRMRLPAQFRAELQNNYVVTIGAQKCLFVLTSGDFECLASQFADADIFDKDKAKVGRMLHAYCVKPEEDAQGRFVLPASLKELAGIKKNIVILGYKKRIEIWAEEVWNKYLTDSEGFDKLLDNIAEKTR